MKGDFSKKYAGQNKNFSGVLHQQGRVLLDADWNEQTQINNEWQNTAAQDAFGPGVAAVPSDTPTAFEVDGAGMEDGNVVVGLLPGRVWADGRVVHLAEESEFIATYYGNMTDPPSSGLRDAVVLEIWREEINAFQLPEEMIEPALGGPDTTERVHTAMALRLLRLGPGDTCENIRHQLEQGFKTTGTLSVSLDPTTTTDGDCPVIESGGYTGFEHSLYRIEIAQVNDDREPMFKWSQFNGGLVGRGQFHNEGDEISIGIEANDQAIKHSGLNRFYLEIIENDEERDEPYVGRGHWYVSYGAIVNLNDDGDRLIVDPDHIYYESEPRPRGSVFFRLWHDIESIRDYIVAITGPHLLEHGIRLEFQMLMDTFMPGDFWTFSVRAGESNPHTIFLRQPPEGIQYHRVPLAILNWNTSDGTVAAEVEDCRNIFRPLTKQKVCCSYTVGREGDFPTIQEAVDALKLWGGEICLLPGVHRASVRIENQFNIRIKGCGLRTLIVPEEMEENDEVQPIFQLINSKNIILENMLLVNFAGTVIKTEGGGWHEIRNNTIFAVRYAIHAGSGLNLNIHHNLILMLERIDGEVAIFSSADNVRIERNKIILIPSATASRVFGEDEDENWVYDCFNLRRLQEDEHSLTQYIHVFIQLDFSGLTSVVPMGTRGGIQIGSGSERIKILENRIQGGAGNGITLGSSLEPDVLTGLGSGLPREHKMDPPINEWYVIFVKINGEDLLQGEKICLIFENENDSNISSVEVDSNGVDFHIGDGDYTLKVPLGYGILGVDFEPDEIGGVHTIKLDRIDDDLDSEILWPIREIVIQGNEISHMGLSGIGTPQMNLSIFKEISNAELCNLPFTYQLAYFLGVLSGYIYDLVVQQNHISRCLQAKASDISDLLTARGEGGVSLGLCENVVIRENRIESNGSDHNQPVCGVFLSGAVQAEILDNQILNNGPFDANAGLDLQPGIRGGVIIRLATSILTDSAEAQTNMSNDTHSTHETINDVLKKALTIIPSLGGSACRVHDNIIRQPVGQALRIVALGPLSITDNNFTVDITNNPYKHASLSRQVIEGLAGTVCLLNLGKPAYRRKVETSSSEHSAGDEVSNNISEETISNPLYPSGSTIFSNNQTRLGVAKNVSISQFIASWDDVSFSNNQSDVLEAISHVLRANSIVIAPTVRAIGNRLKEPI